MPTSSANELRAGHARHTQGMKRFAPAVLLVYLVIVGCTESDSSPEAGVTEVSSPVSTPQTIPPTTTTTVLSSTLTLREREEPPVFTEFMASTACDPAAEDANLQVVQAFVTAYNDQDGSRLTELVSSDSVSVADMSGIPHLGEDDWTGVTSWAEEGWSVGDRFELTRLVMYDSGSVFEVERSNDLLRDHGIESLRHSWKVPSYRCAISQVLYLPFESLGASECRFWEVFADDLAEGTTQSISEPEACSE